MLHPKKNPTAGFPGVGLSQVVSQLQASHPHGRVPPPASDECGRRVGKQTIHVPVIRLSEVYVKPYLQSVTPSTIFGSLTLPSSSETVKLN